MTETVIPVYVRTEPESIPTEFRDGLIIDYFSNTRANTLDMDLHTIFQTLGMPPQVALDFTLIAASVYAADKKVLRKRQPDGWTRSYFISIPVHDADAWQSISDSMVRALSFLTGDVWRFDFRPIREWVLQPGLQLTDIGRIDAISLFSGGLDSTIGAIDLLEQGLCVLLVGHYDNNHTKRDQARVFEELVKYYPGQVIDLLQARVRPAPKTRFQAQGLPSVVENSTRSRSIVFWSLGLLAASTISSNIEVFMPENGFISLNIPLTPSRRGSNSTRTTHPYFMDSLATLLKHVGFSNSLRNSYQTSTKGEMIQNCRNMKVLSHLVGLTLSCAHPEVSRFVKLPRKNCGYCYPCIIRRAALHSAMMDDGQDYNWDVCLDADMIEYSKRGKDIRAVFWALNENERHRNTLLSVLSSSPLSRPLRDLHDLRRMYERGMQEIKSWIEAQATPEVLRLVGFDDKASSV